MQVRTIKSVKVLTMSNKSANLSQIEKLKCVDYYSDWEVAMESYLEQENVWK